MTVVEYGEEFLSGADGEWTLEDWPNRGVDTVVAWSEARQNIEIVDILQARTDPPLPPPPSQEGVRALLGTWRFTHRLGVHEWTFSRIETVEGISLAAGLAESRHAAVGGRINDLVPGAGTELGYEYAVLWLTASRCQLYIFNLTSATAANGYYAPASRVGESCGEITDLYPTTGTRTHAFLSLVVPGIGLQEQGAFTPDLLPLLDDLSEALENVSQPKGALGGLSRASVNEDVYNAAFCTSIGGSQEVRHDYTYPTGESYVLVDCETEDTVYEGGLDKRSSLDSVQQALFFASLTGKEPAVVIYDTDGTVGRFEHRIRVACVLAGVQFLRVPSD